MRRKRGGSWTIIFLCCTLAVPTVAELMGLYPEALTLELARPALAVGALLGVAHILLRPLLRFMFSFIGCLTFGLFGVVIDVAMLYGCAHFVPGFEVFSLLYALLTAVLINAICAVAAGRR